MNDPVAHLIATPSATLLSSILVLSLGACGDSSHFSRVTSNGGAGNAGEDAHCAEASGVATACGGVESERLACVQAAFQSAIDAAPGANGSYCYEVIHSTPWASPSPAGFGIAVIDAGAYLSSMTIYRDRVLGHYTSVGDHYEAVDPELEIPSPAARVLETLAVNQALASSVETAALARQFVRKYNLLFPEEYTHTHGDLIFNALAEFNPSAYFLLFHEDGGFHAAEVDSDDSPSFARLACAVREPGGPSNLHAFWQNRAKSVVRIISEARTKGAEIRFVNDSAGLTPDDTVNITRSVCPALQFTDDELGEIQRAYAEYLEQIAASDVLLVQSALYAPLEISEANWRRYYADCEPIPNRVRVGYALGAKDAPAAERIDTSMHDGLRCIDLLIGMGWTDMETPTTRALQMSSIGTGHGNAVFWGTSIAAPLGLSVVAQYWQDGHTQNDSQALAAAFRSDSSGVPVIRDILEDHLFLNSRDDYLNNLRP